MTNFASPNGPRAQHGFMTVKLIVRFAEPAPQSQADTAAPPGSAPSTAYQAAPPRVDHAFSQASEPPPAVGNVAQPPVIAALDPSTQIASFEPGDDVELPIFQPEVRQTDVTRDKYPQQSVINNLMRIAHTNGMRITSIMIRPDGTVCVSSDPDQPRVLNSSSPRKYTAR